MGVAVEFNPDLALRNLSEFKSGNRMFEECVPENLEIGNIYTFQKKGQRIYSVQYEVSLTETTTAGGVFSKPLANVLILEVKHILQNNEVWTVGRYKVVQVFERPFLFLEIN